jgi:hypothetical protein
MGIAPVATPLRALGSDMGVAGFGCGRVWARFSVVALAVEFDDVGDAVARGFVDPAGAFFRGAGLPCA